MKKIHSIKSWIQKNVERIPLASFVSALKGIGNGIKSGLNTREVRLAFMLVVLMIVLMIFSLIMLLGGKPEQDGPVVKDEEQKEEVFYHPFTGEELEEKFEGEEFVYGIMVENAFDAWPLSGVEDAFLVIEAPVEGSIPRFLTFFTKSQEVDQIGPVRSARPYYVDWAYGFDVIYGHVGGSPEALEMIRSLALMDMNEFFVSGVFWRSGARSAPHNVYTSTERLNRHAEDKEFKVQSEGWFTFEQKEEAPEEKIEEITITWFDSASSYDVNWELEEGTYRRTQGTRNTKSLDGNDYLFENVIIMETDVRSIDEVDRKRLRTEGEGRAIIFQNGDMQEVEWKRQRDGKLRFEDIWGNEITMIPGQTWISVIPSLEQVEWE
jgi:hypothetical protein